MKKILGGFLFLIGLVGLIGFISNPGEGKFVFMFLGLIFGGAYIYYRADCSARLRKNITQMANNLYTSTRQINAKKIASDLQKSEVYVRCVLADLQQKKAIPNLAEII